MKVKLLSVESMQDGIFKVCLLIGESPEQFIFAVDAPQHQDEIALIRADKSFRSAFRFNQHLAASITQIVGRVSSQEALTFPIDLDEWMTPDEAAALQKAYLNRFAPIASSCCKDTMTFCTLSFKLPRKPMCQCD